MNQFGNRIASLREKLALKQEDLSMQLGISRASLSHYETGRRTPDFETLNKLADFFKVSIDYLVGRVDSPFTDEQIEAFMNHLDLSDEQLLERYTLTIDGRRLSTEEAKRFIAFVRAERAMNP